MAKVRGALRHTIKKCYPPSKELDKRPIPNELSMLVFYLQSRPGKIPKAGDILYDRAVHFYNKSQLDNLLITAMIVHELVNKLAMHLSLFAEQSLDIINLAIDAARLADNSFLSEVTSLYADFNRAHTGVLFAGHPSFGQRFLDVTFKFFQLTRSGNVQPRISATDALTSLAQSPALATSIGQQSVDLAVKGLESNMPKSESPLYRDNELPKDPSDAQELLADKAVSGLRAFLNTSSLEQIVKVINRVLEWLGASTGQWQSDLIVSLARWVPPQNRFIVTTTVVSAMAKLPTENVSQLRAYSTYLDSLLDSDASKIGLSVVDILRNLAAMQHRLIESPPQSADSKSIQELLACLRDNIRNLAEVNIYPGQVTDMIGELLSKYASVPSNSPTSETLPTNLPADDVSESGVLNSVKSTGSPAVPISSRPVGVMINDFHDISDILDLPSVKDQRLPSTLWEGTQWLLTLHQPQLLVAYAETFSKYAKISRQTAPVDSKKGSLITRQLCEAAFNANEASNYIAIYYSLIAHLESLGSKSSYVLPWLYKLLPEPGNEVAATGSNVGLSSLGLASILAVFKITGHRDAASVIFDTVSSRVNAKHWLPGITYPIAVSLQQAVSSAVSHPVSNYGVGNLSLAPVENWNLSGEVVQSILHPSFELNAPLDSDDIRSPKGRARSISSVSGRRSISGRSQASFAESQAPKVNDLRRRQTDTFSLRMPSAAAERREKKVSLPAKRASPVPNRIPGEDDTDLMSLLQGVRIEGSAKGKVTV